MNKFKIGDKVRMIQPNYDAIKSPIPTGSLGTVVEMYSQDLVKVVWNENTNGYDSCVGVYFPQQIELTSDTKPIQYIKTYISLQDGAKIHTSPNCVTNEPITIYLNPDDVPTLIKDKRLCQNCMKKYYNQHRKNKIIVCIPLIEKGTKLIEDKTHFNFMSEKDLEIVVFVTDDIFHFTDYDVFTHCFIPGQLFKKVHVLNNCITTETGKTEFLEWKKTYKGEQ